ncbi:Poly(ADP-ribose) glycohydrolase 1 [Sesamum alatum]|uniref:poly(ADP-ribose) glycohydrolase n=1 Tax=Sesamum alatum TaxID=300844 RepID=A0AAE1YVQ5_9LAMI|nr:Poly(ADP-ribose) glycohydrolase 1 [Sesamum alatum]
MMMNNDYYYSRRTSRRMSKLSVNVLYNGYPYFPSLHHPLESELPAASSVQQEYSDDRRGGIGIIEFFQGKNIFITGATGLVGKAFIEKLLRSTSVGKIYLLIKAEDKEAAVDRLKKEVVDSELFKSLREKHGNYYEAFVKEKLIPVVGNICDPNLGMDSNSTTAIIKDVDVIIESAASTSLNDRYDNLLDINVNAPQRLMRFAKTCKNLKLFVHISTAYVNGRKAGLILEKPLIMGENGRNDDNKDDIDEIMSCSFPRLDLADEISLAMKSCQVASQDDYDVTKNLKRLGQERANLFGWYNAYHLTKAMGEMVLNEIRQDIPVLIIRPTVIESSYKQPFPGWIQGNRMFDPVIISYGKGQLPAYLADPQVHMDIIPVDMVVNSTIAAIAKHATSRRPQLNVYHVASGVVNPLRFCDFFEILHEYFNSTPLTFNIKNISKIKCLSNMSDLSKYTRDAISQRNEMGTADADEKMLQKLRKQSKAKVAYAEQLCKMYEFIGFFKGSNVNSGQLFALAIADLRNSLGISALHSSASLGFSLFFDDLMDKDNAKKWFEEVVPQLANLLLRLPALLETHYQNAGLIGMETSLRLLDSQQSGMVLLSQELIAALLVCALFCLFPTTNRGAKHLPTINFDTLFMSLYERYDVKQEHKIKCILHYFERTCSEMPMGNVSFERKVLPLQNSQSNIVYPEADFWSKSTVSLCRLEARTSGLIEDQPTEALEVDFANKNIGGGALRHGCVQEEIRCMINPELIVARLFLPSMADNEAVEIVGAERFSNYSGYAASFRFCGDHVDTKSVDTMGRRRTRIIAIDALSRPGKRQYALECLLRETNKAFCGFFDQHKIDSNGLKWLLAPEPDQVIGMAPESSKTNILTTDDPSTSCEADTQTSYEVRKNNKGQMLQYKGNEGEIGVATGNWGCGAFGGDPEVKAIIQWLAASQALRPFVLYHTFNLEALQKLELVVQWILSQGWTVGEVWNILVEYSTQRLKRQTKIGFFNWLLPSLYDDVHPMILDVPHSM